MEYDVGLSVFISTVQVRAESVSETYKTKFMTLKYTKYL